MLTNAIEGQVRWSLHDRMLYATDASLYQVEPLGVVVPASVEDAVRAIAACASLRLAMLPRGGGTSLAGQCTNRAVVIDFSPMCRGVGAVEARERTVTVEPGVTVDDLNDAIAASGLFFAPDPATSRHASIGGCIGNNAAGARSILYGRTSESVLSIDAALWDGTRARFATASARRDERVRTLTLGVVDIVRRHEKLIRERFPKTIRRNAGYALDMVLQQLDAGIDPLDVNLSPLLCGSEGTLAWTLGATLRLHPRPKAKALGVLAFATLDDAIAAVPAILSTRPSAVELLDDLVVGLARANVEYRTYVDLLPALEGGGEPHAVLYVEYFGESPAEIDARIVALRRSVATRAIAVHHDARAMMHAWKLRKAGEPLLHGIPGARKPITFIEDNAIPVEQLATFVRELRDIVAKHGTRAAFYAHASVGVLHVRPLLDIHDPEDRVRMQAIAVEAADLARCLGGVMSGEHGDGRVRSPLLERFFGPELMSAFREVKRLFDPHNLLNPGNIVDITGENPRPIESMAEKLRVEPRKGRPLAFPSGLETFYTYDDEHGFDGAVEMCNGSGVCRKLQGGTMCPSYMALRDERHSTRGRGNALRLAITGQLRDSGGASIWNDEETKQTLGLCLSCKACKTECPSNVDIAKLKAEYTAQGFRNTPASLATRLMGAVRTLNRLGSLTPDLANRVGRVGVVRGVIDRVLGLDPRRSLPMFSRSLSREWGPSRATDATKPAVVLFGDCFTMYNESSIGLATRRVYEACGYRVVLADAGCCGRAKISLGLLGEAINEADATLDRLRTHIEDSNVAAILFTEPSCLSAIKDDWRTLKLSASRELRDKLAKKSWLAEQFLDKAWESHPIRPSWRQPEGTLIVHGHCHQKALWGVQSSSAILSRVFGESRVRMLDSGCCGMAGSFGFTPERFDLSMQIGELSVLPAARAAGPRDVLVAPGTSCRHQVHDGAQRAARHPMQVLAELLMPQDQE